MMTPSSFSTRMVVKMCKFLNAVGSSLWWFVIEQTINDIKLNVQWSEVTTQQRGQRYLQVNAESDSSSDILVVSYFMSAMIQV